MNAISATFDGQVFIPATRPRIPRGRTVLLSVTCSPSKRDTAKPALSDFIGLLRTKTGKVATLDEINTAATDGWAGLKQS